MINGKVFDIEANGLKPTKIHCLGANLEGKIKSTEDYDNMRSFFTKADVLIGHNIQRYDIPSVERLLGIKVKAKLIDTLALSWYLEPERLKHGLEEYGEEFGVPKPKIDDWENLSLDEYKHRVEEDVRINTLLWERQYQHLINMYETDEEAWRLIDYLAFKMDCAREQEEVKWKLDIDRCERVLEQLRKEAQIKVEELTEAMPKVPVYKTQAMPKKPYKMNGELSEAGKRWFTLLKEQGLPEDNTEPVKYVASYEPPNPGSHTQIKDWLYSLGWIPETFQFKRDKQTGEVRKIPQVQMDKTKGQGLCPSVKRLFSKEPALESFEGLSIINHRIAILEGFLENVDEEGYVQAQIQGLTNTLRFKHKVVVNLPGVDKPYGADIRGCLIAPEGYELAGSDMSSLEDRTKQHFMWDYDPDYVTEMMTPDFDPHIDLCVAGNLMSIEDAGRYKNADETFKHTELYKTLKAIRYVGKTTNYASVYGAGKSTVARAAGITEREAELLLEAYWRRNWSVKKLAEDQEVRVINGLMWLFNPVSRFWYSLRFEKDRFSTLNQGTGVYCFDTWVKHVRDGGPKVCGQFHDEWIAPIKKGNRERLMKHVQMAMDKTNEELKLNRELGFDLQFGDSYAEIH